MNNKFMFSPRKLRARVSTNARDDRGGGGVYREGGK